jgi:hypothetical protein
MQRVSRCAALGLATLIVTMSLASIGVAADPIQLFNGKWPAIETLIQML